MVTGWTNDAANDAAGAQLPSIFYVVRELSSKTPALGARYIEEELFRHQDAINANTGNILRFWHLLEMAAAHSASVMTSVRLVEANCVGLYFLKV
jgi:hypothetical protein